MKLWFNFVNSQNEFTDSSFEFVKGKRRSKVIIGNNFVMLRLKIHFN